MSATQIKKFELGWLATNCYLIIDQATQRAMVVDPGGQPNEVIAYIKQNQLEPIGIINTHGHGDHISGNSLLSGAFNNLPILIHCQDEAMLTNDQLNLSAQYGFEIGSPSASRCLNDGDIIEIGQTQVKVIHTPGHTPGSICLLTEDCLLSGDTLFFESVGRTDFPGGDSHAILESIKNKLYPLAATMKVYPGHGPSTSIGHEQLHNHFVRIKVS